jgi:hypothetical protein
MQDNSLVTRHPDLFASDGDRVQVTPNAGFRPPPTGAAVITHKKNPLSSGYNRLNRACQSKSPGAKLTEAQDSPCLTTVLGLVNPAAFT